MREEETARVTTAITSITGVEMASSRSNDTKPVVTSNNSPNLHHPLKGRAKCCVTEADDLYSHYSSMEPHCAEPSLSLAAVLYCAKYCILQSLIRRKS
jgi:hypothetical protein